MKTLFISLEIIGIMLLCGCLTTSPDDKGFSGVQPDNELRPSNVISQAKGKRRALVIGVTDYQFAARLGKNPINDAEDMRTVFEELGFTVTLLLNIKTPLEFKNAINAFGKTIKSGDEVVFYYSGHGIQNSGINYLLPTQANIQARDHLEIEALSVDYLLGTLKEAQPRNQYCYFGCVS